MKNLNDQMYDFISGNRKDITDFRQFNLPYTETSVDFTYIFKSCISVFQEDYIKFLIDVGLELDLDIPDDLVDDFKQRIEKWHTTSSPKYDKLYQVRTFYQDFINEHKSISN